MNSIWLNAVRASGGAVPWYLAGGAPMPVAAYQPIGAASLAASYVNLSNPGTFDAAPGVAPTHSGATGWGFDGTTQYLTTGVVVSSFDTWTIIARFSGHILNTVRAAYLFGARMNDEGPDPRTIGVVPSGSLITNRRYINGASPGGDGGSKVASGVMAVAGRGGYYNGVLDTALLTETVPAATSGAFDLYIGNRNELGTGPFSNGYFVGNIQAVAIYSSTLTAPQVAAVSAAMAAL